VCCVDHSKTLQPEGLSCYDYPIISIKYPASSSHQRFVTVLAHEISHFYGLGHHNNGADCIMDEGTYTIDYLDPSSFWCSDCEEAINNNKSKFLY
jgi:predicted Zn-dependent protease